MDVNKAIFVFGSNEGGYHGAGAAKFAREYKGAQLGLAFGLSGQSFAIPTKDITIRKTLSLRAIQRYVDSFIWQAQGNGPFAEQMKSSEFQVTRIGCGLAGLMDADVAPMFKDAPNNCWFDTEWKPYLYAVSTPGVRTEDFKFWGHK